MIGNFEDRAVAQGWQRVSGLSVRALGHSSLLTIEKDGYVLALLGLDDAFALLSDNPGASREVADRRWQCSKRAAARERVDIGPCPMRGFAPVYVLSNLVDRGRSSTPSALSDEELIGRLLGGIEHLKTYSGYAVNSTLTWEELTVLSKSAGFAPDIADELVSTPSNAK